MTKLPFKVECKSLFPFFEVIAAFDVESAALAYAFECEKTNPGLQYRVRKGSRVCASNVLGMWAAA